MLSLRTVEDQAGFGTMEALLKITSLAQFHTIKFSMASSLGTWRPNPLVWLRTVEDRAGFAKTESGPLLKSTSLAQFRTTKFSMASTGCPKKNWSFVRF